MDTGEHHIIANAASKIRNSVSRGVLALPNAFIALCLTGALLALAWPRIGITISLISSICLFITATPAFSSYLTKRLESKIKQDTNFSSAQAIVVLSADVRMGNGPDRLGPFSLDNAAMTAEAYRQLSLPVAVSGGWLLDSQISVAALMKVALIEYFGVPVTWTEDRSTTTYENAAFTAQQLRQANIGTVVVIAQSLSLPRAIWSFERAGLRALPWPTLRGALAVTRLQYFLPSTAGLNNSFDALHELIGALYYRFRY